MTRDINILPHRHALQDAHAAEQLCNQLHPLVASIESQLLQSEQRLFSQLDGMLTDYFLQMQQLCRSYTQQQGVLDAGRATDAELEHYTTLNRTVVRQEKVRHDVAVDVDVLRNTIHLYYRNTLQR